VKQLYEIAGLCPDEAVRDREEIKAEKLCARGTGRSLKVIERNGRKKKTGALGTSWWRGVSKKESMNLSDISFRTFKLRCFFILLLVS
jgi:hypothetical protein